MITDLLANASTYYNLNERITESLRYLANTDCENLELGRHDIRDSQIFALVQEYSTKRPQDVKFESHRKFIDVQYVVNGVESIGYADISQLTVTQDYDAQTDAMLFDGEGVNLFVPAGTFVILYPQDGHKPCLIADEQQTVRKVVIKVEV
jgi:YhcH/YjgK/YiaL family protein